MNWKNTSTRYGTLSIAMHWLMLGLLIGVYAAINLHDLFPKGSELRAALQDLAFHAGAFGLHAGRCTPCDPFPVGARAADRT